MKTRLISYDSGSHSSEECNFDLFLSWLAILGYHRSFFFKIDVKSCEMVTRFVAAVMTLARAASFLRANKTKQNRKTHATWRADCQSPST